MDASFIISIDNHCIDNKPKTKTSLKQRCAEIGAISLEQFEEEFWQAFEDGYRKHRNKNL